MLLPAGNLSMAPPSGNYPSCIGNYPAANLVEQTKEICQGYRAAQYQVGGNVGIILKQFPYP